MNQKNLFFILTIILLIIAIVFVIFYFKLSKKEQITKEPDLNEVIKQLTAPEIGNINTVPESLQKELTAPSDKPINPITKDLIQNITAP